MFAIQWSAFALLLLSGAVDCKNDGTPLAPVQYRNATMYTNGGDSTRQFSMNSMAIRGFGKIKKRQEFECPPGTLSCGDEVWCHPPGTECCPEDHSHNCPEGEICCTSEGKCAMEGTVCCPGKNFSCPPGDICCNTGIANCAPPDGTCCGNGYCKSDEQCCGNGNGCAPKDSVCCGDSHCKEGEICMEDGTCAPEGSFLCNDMLCYKGEQCCNTCAPADAVCCGEGYCQAGNVCCQDQKGPYCAKKCLPTIMFPKYQASKEIWENTCEGLKEYFKKTGNNEFDWNGPGKANRKTTRQNRRNAGCAGNLVCPPGTNCDEFPMASLSQGGKGATIRCVPDWTNAFFGQIWNSWRAKQVSLGNLAKGTKFRIIIQDCKHTGLIPKRMVNGKRDDNSSLVLNQHGNVTVFSSSAFGNYTDGNNVVFLPLSPDESNPGTYHINYNLASGQSISSGVITDEYGEPYLTLDDIQSGASNSTSFELDSSDNGPVYFYGYTTADDVDMNVTVKAPPAPKTTASSTNGAAAATAVAGVIVPLGIAALGLL